MGFRPGPGGGGGGSEGGEREKKTDHKQTQTFTPLLGEKSIMNVK